MKEKFLRQFHLSHQVLDCSWILSRSGRTSQRYQKTNEGWKKGEEMTYHSVPLKEEYIELEELNLVIKSVYSPVSLAPKHSAEWANHFSPPSSLTLST